MDYKYTGIILNKKNVAETDRIYTVYTAEAGKIRVLGKGVRKPTSKLAGSLEPITLVEIFVAKSRGMGKITGSIISNNFSKIKASLEFLGRVFRIFELFSKSVGEQQKDKEIFKLFLGLLESMEKIENDANKADILFLGFLFKFLDKLGYRAEVGKCVNCGKKLESRNNYFSPSLGGVLCGSCHGAESRQIKISDGSIKTIRIFLKNDIKNFSKLQISRQDINNLKIIVQESLNWSL